MTGSSRPRRNTTARSYSRSTRTLSSAATTRATATAMTRSLAASDRFCEAQRLRAAPPLSAMPARARGTAPARGSRPGGGGSRAAASGPRAAPRAGPRRAAQPPRARGCARPPTTSTSSASATSISEMPRWKRPASECGHGSSGRTISRPAVGVGAGVLARAAVADVGLGAVAHQPPLVVELVRPEVLALRARQSSCCCVVARSRPCGSAASAGACGPTATRARRRRAAATPRSRRRAATSGAHVTFAAAASSAPAFGDARGLGDLGEQDVLGLLERHPLDGVADAEVGDVEHRDRPAGDEDDVAGQPQPLDQRCSCRR